MKKSFLFIFIFFLTMPFLSFSQDKTNKDKKNPQYNVTKKGVLKYHEMAIGAQVNSNGWGILFEKNRIPSDRMKRVFQVNVFSTRHPKQYKSSISNSPFLGGSNNAFYYGKINSFYTANAMWGWRHHLAWSAKLNGVDLNFGYLIGPALGITKGYALNIQYEREDIRVETYSEENKADFLDLYKIRGYAGPLKGWDKLGFYPGLSAKMGLNFNLSSNSSSIKAVDFGLACDIYYKNVPIMAIAPNSFIYPKLYLSLQFGKRW